MDWQTLLITVFVYITMLLHFFSEPLILLDFLLEVIFKDFKALRNFCKSVVYQ